MSTGHNPRVARTFTVRDLFALLCAVAVLSVSLHGQRATRPRPVAPPAPTGPASVQKAASTGIELTAASANVAESGTAVRIHLFRWSNDDERTPLLAALNPPARGGGAPAAADGARGGAAPPAGDAAAAGRGARAAGAAGGAAGRGGRGGRGAPPPTPIEALTAAIGRAPTLGYIWTTDVTGYSIKYAWHMALPDGGERIVLVTDRRLGAYSPGWKLKSSEMPTDYEFTVIEMHLDAKGIGEARSSLTTKVVVDGAASTLAIDNYTVAPVILQNVKKRQSGT